MTLRKLALGSALGMLASGLAAYLLPLPQASPPAPAPSVAPSARTVENAAPTPTARSAHLAEMEQEIARLRALLDAGPGDGSAAVPDDASTSALEDATAAPHEHASPKDLPQDRSQYAPVAPAPIGPVTAMPDLAPDSCRERMSAEQFAALARTFPSVRQLPPDKIALLKSASPACTCGVAPGSFARCQSWCRSQGYSPEKATCDQYQRCHCLEDY